MESFVAMMALVAARALDPGIYFAMSSPAALIGDTPERAAEVISNWGWVISPETIRQTAVLTTELILPITRNTMPGPSR